MILCDNETPLLTDLLGVSNVNKEHYSFMKFLGYRFVGIGYTGGPSETKWQVENKEWMECTDLKCVGRFFVNISKYKWREDKELRFRYDWNQLIEVISQLHAIGLMPDFTPYSEQMVSRCYTVIKQLEDDLAKEA